MSKKEKKENQTHEKLNQLHNSGKIPKKVYLKGTELKRWQSKEYPSAVHYNRPDNSTMGRYNDPTGRTGVCYVSESAVLALAESYGRQYQDDEDFYISVSHLEVAQICTVKVEKNLKTVDMRALQALLHITTDKLTGVDYGVTSEIVNFFANTLSGEYDGISYTSRHFGEGVCIALFEQESEQISTLSMEKMSSYRDSYYLPEGWEYDDIDAEEILTEILGFNIVEE